MPKIAEATDAVINITTGGSTKMTVDERLAYAFAGSGSRAHLAAELFRTEANLPSVVKSRTHSTYHCS